MRPAGPVQRDAVDATRNQYVCAIYLYTCAPAGARDLPWDPYEKARAFRKKDERKLDVTETALHLFSTPIFLRSWIL